MTWARRWISRRLNQLAAAILALSEWVAPRRRSDPASKRTGA